MDGKYVVDINGTQVNNPVSLDAYTEQYVQDNNLVPDLNVPAHWLAWGIGSVVVLTVLIGFFSSWFSVGQQEVKIVERFGKFKKLATAGLNFKIPFLDKIAGSVGLRTQQINVQAETKTKDNVFIHMVVAVQFSIPQLKAYEAFYKLQNPTEQISAYVFDTVRSQVPKLTLDEVFEKKEDIALAVKTELTQVMDDFGYSILTALVTDIDPAQKVKDSMNEINTQQRLRLAANEKGEAEKILAVKQAEGQSESKRLQGEGIAKERLAIVEGLEQSIEKMTSAGIKPSEVMNILLLTQYFDTLKGMEGAKTILLPGSPDGVSKFTEEIRNALIVGNEASK